MSTADLPKAYDPSTVEPQAMRVWTDEKLFHAEPTDPGEPYSIAIPPPNVTAALHLGHALNNTLQDILTRWHRMLGDNTCWLPGTDHAGIATQTVVEKRVLAEQGKRRTEFAREEFVKLIQAWKDEYEQRITDQLKAMGCSCDWDRQAFTMDEPRAKAVREAFFRLFKDGLIYRGKRLVNWDPATQTALADDEVEMEEVDGHFYYLRYPLVEEQETKRRRDGETKGEAATSSLRLSVSSSPSPTYVTVATTRPETMLGDTAVAINPKDPRAAALRGKFVRLPIVNRVIPIIEDDYVVLPDSESDDPKAQFATGFLKVTPAHDPNDYEIGQRHKLPMINVFAPDATISDQHGWPREDFDQGGEDLQNLLGLDRFEARKAVVEWFRKNDLLEDVKPYRHSVGHSYRSHVPIEPYLSDQWYCKVTDPRLAGAALRAMAADQRDSSSSMGVSPMHSEGHGRDAHATESWEGQLRFYPARYAKTFQTWHENIRDWCISRQLWWGHRIPVWKLSAAFGSKTRGEKSDAFVGKWMPIREYMLTDRLWFIESEQQVPSLPNGDFYFCVRSEEDEEVIGYLESLGAERDPDVLDTWFSSGLWPLSTLGWPDGSEISNLKSALNVWNPTSVLCTAREIITLWVSRMTMFNIYFLGRLPFRDVFIHAMIQDGEGRKMSKSLGNGVDPLDIIASHGADAMRFTLASMATNTQDVRMPVERDERTGRNTSPKFDLGRNFCNKLWNAARFAIGNLGEDREQGNEGTREQGNAPSTRSLDPSVPRSLPDRWILSRLATTIRDANDALANYRFDQYAKACYDFFWRDLCDWYIEAIKPAMRDPQQAPHAASVLATALDAALRLMHPMIPFITETIWWRLNEVRPQRGLRGIDSPASERLIVARWPKADESLIDAGAEATFARLQEITTAIRNVRNEHKVEPRRNVPVAILAPAEIAQQIESNRMVIETLATATLRAVGPDVKPDANAARAVIGNVEIYLEGLVDPQAEQQRINKRREELNKQVTALRGRLGNESYIKKAPPHLVQQTRDQLAEAEAELAKLGA